MRRYRFLCPLVVVAITTTGCTGAWHDMAVPERRPLGQDMAVYRAPPDPGASKASLAASDEPEGELGLRDALAFALMHNPKLASASWGLRLGEARVLQAGLLPNPELEAEVEGVAGSGEHRGFDAATTTIRLSQLVELGGKRSARRRVAGSEGLLAGWDHEAERLAVMTEATLGFIDVLAVQERLRLTQELVSVSEKTLATVTERVDAGKVSPLEKTKAEVELANNRIESEKAGSELRSARKRLASTWGSTTPRFSKVMGELDRVSDLPAYEDLQALIERTPDIARWAQEMEQRLAALALERARRVPDLTVGLGVQHFEETNDHALTFGISLPLPIFDRNQGGVIEAHHRLAQIGHARKDAEVRAATALAESYETLTMARAEVVGLNGKVVPGATMALDAAREGYQQGKFGYIEVLDAQRTLFEARSRLLDAQARYHRSVAIVESLIGARLDALAEQERKER